MSAEARKVLNTAELLLIQRTEVGISNMQKREMIYLILRIQYYFPVRPFLDSVAAQQPLLIEWVAMNLLNHPRYILSESLGRSGTQVDENESFPYVRGDRFQSEAVLVDIVKVGFVGYPRELASRIVSPTVKPADEPALAKSLLVVDQPIAAMYADVMECPYFPVLAANQQDGSVGDCEVPDHVTTRLR